MSSVQPFQFEPERNMNEEDSTDSVSQNKHQNEEQERRDEARVGQRVGGVCAASASPWSPRESVCCQDLQFLTAAVHDIPCITAHENFDAVCLNRDVLWAALVSLHDRESAALPNRNRVTNRMIVERREVAIRCLVVYLREKEEDLFKEQSPGGDIRNEAMKTVVTRGAMMSNPASTRIMTEGTEVLEDLDIPRACTLLMGLIYALNFSYTKELKNTFEMFQKIFLELDGLKTSPKAMSLKNKLLKMLVWLQVSTVRTLPLQTVADLRCEDRKFIQTLSK